MLTGSLVAIVTPWLKTAASITLRLTAWWISTSKTAPAASSPSAPRANRPPWRWTSTWKVVESVVKRANKRVAVIAGTGANSTREAIELTEAAASLGVDSALSVVPYYNRPTQEGMYQHLKAIAEARPLPLILYNVPGRTVADMSNDTALRLAEIPISSASRTPPAIWSALAIWCRAPADFALYTGDDASAMAFCAVRRSRRDFGHRQRGAQADERAVPRGAGWRLPGRARHQ